MLTQFSRTELLIGKDGTDLLAKSRVAVFGLGGVGGHAAEALARSGIGSLDLIDNDKVELTNLNRQLFATHKTVGMQKTEAAAKRLLSICPQIRLRLYDLFVLPETVGELDFSSFDYVIDAIDTVSGKLAIIEEAIRTGVPVISSMGAGNRLDPSKLKIADIYDTKGCALAKVMRHELRKRGIDALPVVFSTEEPRRPLPSEEQITGSRREIPGSTAFVPPAAGLLLASYVVNSLLAPMNGTVPEER